MDARPDPRLYLDTVIAPTRSLPAKGYAVLMGVLVAINLFAGTVFFLIGAAPVPIFLGVDVAAVSIAFAVSYGQARRRERVQISAEEVRVLREDGAEIDTIWTSPTAFTRVALETTGHHGCEVRLRQSARRLTIGQVLGPREREGLAVAVDQAIRRARAERHPVWDQQEPGGWS
jgi:uncharacterized membrane protein